MSDAVAEVGTREPRQLGLRVGIVASLLFLLLGFVSIVWVPYPVETVDVGAAMQDPGATHWLGTDALGRDVVSMLMKGTLTSFVVAAIAVAIGAIVGVPLGLAAGAWGGTAEWIARRTGELLLAFPALIIAIVLATLTGPSAVTVMVAVGIFNIGVFAAETRLASLTLKTVDYVAAARLAGMTPFEAAQRHMLPAIASLAGARAILLLGVGIVAEASLSYVGLGSQAPATSLGLMLKDAQTYMLSKPLLAVVPGIVIVLVVVALNLAGVGWRELGDPRLRGAEADHGVA